MHEYTKTAKAVILFCTKVMIPQFQNWKSGTREGFQSETSSTTQVAR